MDYSMMHGLSLENQDQDTGCPHLYLQIYSCYSTGKLSKLCKKYNKRKGP